MLYEVIFRFNPYLLGGSVEMSFSGVLIKGGFFQSGKQLRLFKKTNSIASVIYGKNGSGKSSIARAINEKYATLTRTHPELEFENIIFNKFTSSTTLSEENMDPEEIKQLKLYVYNEKFIMENIQFKDDGLDAIVMLGEQAELEDEKNDINLKIIGFDREIRGVQSELDSLQSKTSPDSIPVLKKNIGETLKKRWAIVEGKIRQGKINASVNDKLINSLLEHQLDSKKNYNTLKNELDQLLSDIDKTQQLPRLSNITKLALPSNYLNVIPLLEKNIKNPELNAREKLIFNLIQKSTNESLKQTREIMHKENHVENCPLCFQDIDECHKHNVLTVIHKLFETKESQIHIDRLKKIYFPQVDINLAYLESHIDSNLIKSLKESIEDYNQNTIELNELIISKINNPYRSINFSGNLENNINIINSLIEAVNQEIQKYNDNFSKINMVKKKASELNFKLAYLDVKELLTIYITRKKSEELSIKKLDYMKNKLEQLQIKLRDINVRQSNVHIAADVINYYLSYIFYDSNRLTLEPSEKNYKIKSRGQNVELKSLSIGERNAISLCYFFAQILEGKSLIQAFQDKALLVIDDPISSFDSENKIGVYSFIRFLLNEFHCGNPQSKSIVLTHDLESLHSFQKIYTDIDLQGFKHNGVFELFEQNLIEMPIRNFNEYSKLLHNAFEFANNTNLEQYENTIGNTLRRILEAFSTFNYKIGIEKLSTNQKILNCISSPQLRDYFKNSMYRLVLHGESHFEEKTKGLIDKSFIESFSTYEKIKTSKSILVFLYNLNPTHLEFHLESPSDVSTLNIEEKISKIKEWEKELVST